jgi:serine/threonine protein kinase
MDFFFLNQGQKDTAPEVFKYLESGQPYGKEIDMWSVGCILYILLCGFSPFPGEHDEIIRRTKMGLFDYPSPYWDTVSSAAKDLVAHLLVVDPYQRFTADEALAHPFFCSVHLYPETQKSYTKFDPRLKFRGAVNVIKALKRMSDRQN